MPSPAYDLTVSDAAPDNLSWAPPLAPGGSAVSYDVLRCDLPSDFMGGTCVESGVATTATDAAVPVPGEIWHYLIRVENGCGSTLGDLSGRQAPDCP